MANNIEIKAQDPVGSRSASPSTQFPEHQHQQNDPILQELGELRIRCLQTENELARATEALQTTQQHSRGQFYEISSLKAKISHLQNIIEKQKMTIARQSKIIAQRPQNVLPSNNSNRNRNGNGNSMVLWTRPPAPMPQTHQQNTLSPLTANHHAGPFASSQSSVPNQDLVRYRYAGHFASRPQVSRPQNGYGMTSNTVVDAFEHKVAYFSSQFHGLWDMTDAFGRNFTARVDEPNGLNIGYVLSFLPDHKMLAAPSNDPTIRCLLVITAINRYIIQDIVKFYNVVRGVDHAVDKELLSLKKNLHAAKNAASIVMHSLLAATIRQIDIVRNRADFDQICQALQDNHSERLWRLIGPAMRPSLAVAARDSLKQIVREAHRLALNLHSAPYEIRFHFPEPHEDFNRETMMVTDAAESRTFVNQKVRLGLTPITWMGDYSQQRRRMRMVTMSKVIIGYGMPPLNEQITRDRRQSEGQEFKE